MEEVGRLLSGGLATYRLTLLVTHEDGPFEIMPKIHEKIGSWVAKDIDKRIWVADGLVCFWCVSFWIGLSISSLRGKSLVEGLGYSGLALIMYTLMPDGDGND